MGADAFTSIPGLKSYIEEFADDLTEQSSAVVAKEKSESILFLWNCFDRFGAGVVKSFGDDSIESIGGAIQSAVGFLLHCGDIDSDRNDPMVGSDALRSLNLRSHMPRFPMLLKLVFGISAEASEHLSTSI
jgi:hypothetical protein